MQETLEYLDPARMQATVLADALLKAHCEDFRVQELPSYEPAGEGEHLFLWVQKRDVSAAQLIHVLSQQLKVSQRDIGVAGQKDRRAVTQQYVSVPAACESHVDAFHDEQIQILRSNRHGNKLRTGHVVGNRFQIILRPTDQPFSSDTCHSVMTRLLQISDAGFPNYYGSQRFGRQAASVQKGVQLLTGSSAKRKAVRASRFERKMLFSAAQSAAFNLVTSWRVKEDLVSTPIDGDVVCRRGGIRPFLYSDRNQDETAQLIPMGPMPGPKMVAAEGNVVLQEQNALLCIGLREEHFGNGKATPGARRPMLAWPTNCSCELTDSGGLLLGFDLSSGSYATVLLREVVQNLHEESAPK